MENISLCPVCNGFRRLSVPCPSCGETAHDEGRLGDLYGPYSPYQPIDEIRMSNGYPDVQHRLCLHMAVCPRCSVSFVASVKET